MFKKFVFYLKKKLLLVLFIGFVIGLLATIYTNKALEYTSTNESCEICHVHPHVFDSWKLSTHYDNPSGFRARCVDCHLPPKGEGYLKEKMIAAARDVYGLVFKDSADYNWELKSTLEYAQHHVFKESCLHCHQNLFPLTLTKEGQDAHLYYTQNEEELRCINCHLMWDITIPMPFMQPMLTLEWAPTKTWKFSLNLQWLSMHMLILLKPYPIQRII
jgi:formylglycine-generating enzyme